MTTMTNCEPIARRDRRSIVGALRGAGAFA